MSKALAKAIQKRNQAEREAARILERDYPIGAGITWDRSGVFDGTVVMHSHGNSIKVKRHKTGKEYWIYMDYILPQR